MLVEWLDGWAFGSGRFFSLLVCLLACLYIYDSMTERFCGLYSTHDECIYVCPLITHDCIPALYMTR